jgi:putative SOS response-associated peptidase YedK
MCGRFENKKIDKDIISLFKKLNLTIEIDDEINDRAKVDIRPTQKIMCVITKDEIYRITKLNWGIKFSDKSPLIFNSRIETIKEKKFWGTLFDRNRCIVPMTGFYEWKTEGKKKTKYRIYLPDHEIFFVPAIYHKDKENNIFTSLITTTPNKYIKEIHHRMPVILDIENAIKFLNDNAENNLKICLPLSDDENMEMEVSN